MSSLPQPLVVLSWPRCCTTALGDSLSRGGQVYDWREIFHPRQLDRAGNYFRWRARLFAEDPAASLPLPDQPARLWRQFMGHLQAQAKDRPVMLIDIKVSALHHLEGAFTRPGTKPHLLRLLAADRVPILRIRCDDPVRQHVSRLLAFHLQSGQTGPLDVDIADMQTRLAEMRRVEADLDRWLADHTPFADVPMTGLLADHQPSGATHQALADLLGQPVRSVPTTLRPTPAAQIPPIANLPELVRHFANTPWQASLSAALRRFQPRSETA